MALVKVKNIQSIDSSYWGLLGTIVEKISEKEKARSPSTGDVFYTGDEISWFRIAFIQNELYESRKKNNVNLVKSLLLQSFMFEEV